MCVFVNSIPPSEPIEHSPDSSKLALFEQTLAIAIISTVSCCNARGHGSTCQEILKFIFVSQHTIWAEINVIAIITQSMSVKGLVLVSIFIPCTKSIDFIHTPAIIIIKAAK